MDFPDERAFDDYIECIGKLEALLNVARGALADIGLNTDMTRAQMQHKANRIYRETEPEL